MTTFTNEDLKQVEFDLVLNLGTFNGRYPWRFTRKVIQMGDKKVATPKIISMKYYTEGNHQGFKATTAHFYFFKDSEKRETSSFLDPARLPNKSLAEQIQPRTIQAVELLVIEPMIRRWIKAIEAGKTIGFGRLMVNKDGLNFKRGLIFQKKHHISWADLVWDYSGGGLKLASKTDPKANILLSDRVMWNVTPLSYFIDRYLKEARHEDFFVSE